MQQQPNLEISTVVGCRMMCSYCPQIIHIHTYKARPNSLRSLSMGNYVRCLETVPTEVGIVFAGMAEPWLNPDCTQMLLYAFDKGHEITVYSTLAGMSAEDVDRIRHIPFRHFTIHLPDADGDMTLNPSAAYLETLRACVEKIPNYNFTQYGMLHPRVKAALGHDVPDSSHVLISRAGNVPGHAIPKKNGPLMCSACGPKINHNILLPNGDVVLCCMTYDLKHILGNLLTQTYESLFLGEEYLRVMRGLAGDESIDIACRNCELSVPP